MLHNLSLLSNEELQNLFTKTNQYMEGFDKNLPFTTLKEIRIDLKEIAAELQKRKDKKSKE